MMWGFMIVAGLVGVSVLTYPLKPSAVAVLELIRVYDGACPQTFADNQIYRAAPRVLELRNLYEIGMRPCTSPTHHHIRRIDEYYMIEGDDL